MDISYKQFCVLGLERCRRDDGSVKFKKQEQNIRQDYKQILVPIDMFWMLLLRYFPKSAFMRFYILNWILGLKAQASQYRL